MNTVTFAKKPVQINGTQYNILLQDKEDSPNALISLSNVLLLSPRLSSISGPLLDLLSHSTQVSLSDLVQTLAAIGSRSPNSSITADYNQLQQILLQMYSGIDINPEFNGSFEDSTEISIFRLFNVGIVHGWIIDAENDPVAYEHVSKYSYHGAQRVLVQSYDIKRGAGTNTTIGQDQSQILTDSNYIKSFLARSATQLTDYGLVHLRELQVEKSFCVLFRNDQFYTLFKNDGELYTLVDDPVYKDNVDVVWKSLKSVNGSQDGYFTGNFIPVGLQNSTSTRREEEVDGAVRDTFRDSAVMQQTVDSSVNNTVAGSPGVNPFSDPQTQSQAGLGSFMDHPQQYQRQKNVPVVDREQQQMQEDEELARRLQAEEDEAAARMFNRNYSGTGGRSRRRNQDNNNSNNNNMAFGASDSDDEDDEYGFSSGFGRNKKSKSKTGYSEKRNKRKDRLKKKKCIIM